MKQKKCSICAKKIDAVGNWYEGNNAQPINNGQCCDRCNMEKVIPARLKEIKQWI